MTHPPNLICYEIPEIVSYDHEEWYVSRKRKGGTTLSFAQPFCVLTQTFTQKAEKTVMDFNKYVSTYSEQEVLILGFPAEHVFNCVGLHEFGVLIDFWQAKEGPELLRILAMRAFRHYHRFKQVNKNPELFAFTCDQGVCRSSAVVLTLLVAAGHLLPSEILFAAEYLVSDKTPENRLSARRSIMKHSGPAILEAAALIRDSFELHLPF
jgi:hypothetical protein